MHIIRFIWRNLDQYRLGFSLILVIQFIIGSLNFLIPVTLAEFTKRNFDASSFAPLLTIITTLYAVGLGLQWIARYYGEALALKFGNHIRSKYFNRLERLPAEQAERHHSGYILSLLNRVGDGLDQIMIEVFGVFAGGLAVIVLFFAFTARESLWLAIANLALLAIFVVTGSLLAKHMVPLATEQNRLRATLLASYADFVANLDTIRKLGINRFAESRIREQTQKVAQQVNRVQRFHANRWLFLHGLYGLIFIGTIAILLWGISTGTIAAAMLILFVSAYAIIRGLIERLAENIKSFMEMNAYLQQLDAIAVKTEGRFIQTNPSHWSRLTLQHIEFAHNTSTQMIQIPAFTISTGEHIAVIGASGQGKSTLLSLLTNQRSPQTGQRLVDNHPYATISPDFFTKHIAVVSQEVELFNVTIRDNLALDAPVSDERLLELLRRLGLADWLSKLPEGLSTVVGEKGVTLSAGQKQRLNLLRGILLDRDIYVLDEPTAHLDDATEQIVVELLQDLLAHKTVIIVTHRPALLALCTVTYEMKQHQLVRLISS